MPIVEVFYSAPYCQCLFGGGETNTAPWTADWNLSPSSVYAVANLSTYCNGSGMSGAAAGILYYLTQDPDTGVVSQPITVSTGGGNIYSGSPTSIVPSFYDNNVVTIVFAWNAFADEVVSAVVTLTAFVFG